MNTLIAFATSKLVSYRGEAPLFSAPPLGWVLHVQAGNGSPYGYFQHAVKPNRKFSHLWVGKDGRVEQYQILDRIAWSQAGGNTTYYAVETEGYPEEPLTTRQLRSLALIHNALRSSDRVTNTVGGRGIITHSAGGVAWGRHACPGSVRAGQRGTIIALAKTLRIPVVKVPEYPGTLRLGSSGMFVRTLQTQLRMVLVDGKFGPVTYKAVVAFQIKHHLTPDGVCGRLTWKALWV